jgi:hypothetical protein
MNKFTISDEKRRMYRERDGILECWAWAFDQFGRPSPSTWYFDANKTFVFYNEQDAVLFALRWA